MSPAQRRALSKQLTRLAGASVADALALVQPGAGYCRRVGITGPPGAGKSSLIARLAPQRLRPEGDLAVVAIDPTSPFSGGAILGDRIRMVDLAHEPRIYIRSLASRGSLDGLADNLADMLATFDQFGMVEVLVETVGVGQVEYAVRRLVDTLVLLITPGSGDQVQMMKSGVLETADIVVVAKSDLPGAAPLAAALASVIKQRERPAGAWLPAIVHVRADEPDGVAALAAEIDRHQDWLTRAGQREQQAAARRRYYVTSLIARRVQEILDDLPPAPDPATAASLYHTVIAALAGPDAR